MADRANSISAPEIDRAGAILEQANADAAGILKAIGILAKTLAEYMQKAHGGEFRICIDHSNEMVLVVQKPDAAIKPKRGEVV